MAKKLIEMSWDEVQAEMSIAGEPKKARRFGEIVMEISGISLDDVNNIPSVDNQILALQCVIAELKNWRKILERRQRVEPPKRLVMF